MAQQSRLCVRALPSCAASFWAAVRMPAGHGTRARTRDSFSRPFRGKGYIPLSVYLRTYHVGDYVDIKVNSAVQKVNCGCFWEWPGA